MTVFVFLFFLNTDCLSSLSKNSIHLRACRWWMHLSVAAELFFVFSCSFSARTHHHVPSKEASLQSAFSMQQRHLPAERCTAAAEQRRRCRRWRRRSAAVCLHPQFVLCRLDPSRSLNVLSKDEAQKQKMMRKIMGGKMASRTIKHSEVINSDLLTHWICRQVCGTSRNVWSNWHRMITHYTHIWAITWILLP